MATQRSGTFFGFILGLVTGLAIAAAVAFFLLRSSPVTKKDEPKPEQPVQQAQVVSQSGQQPATDPNQPMYKDVPQRPASGQTSMESESASTPSSVPTSVMNHPAPAVPAAASRKAASETTKANINQSVYLQAGAFRNREQADNQRGNLAMLGFSSQILQTGSGADRIYRVRMGPYQQSSIAAIQAKLKSNGIISTVIR
ncbi:MAG: SPOR domain-containing protein [Oxalobacter sp.]